MKNYNKIHKIIIGINYLMFRNFSKKKYLNYLIDYYLIQISRFFKFGKISLRAIIFYREFISSNSL